jgi:methionine synthase I (cobalamin-dependent)
MRGIDCRNGALDSHARAVAQLQQYLDFVLAACGNANLLTPMVKHELCDRAAGNYLRQV